MSDPARPERTGHAALTELTSVIRHVTEQLAGFRRRALAAEARLRELERSAAAAEEANRARVSRQAAVELAVTEASGRAAGAVATELLVAENAALRERLGEAVERTRLIGERVRFLRQQLGNGVEK